MKKIITIIGLLSVLFTFKVYAEESQVEISVTIDPVTKSYQLGNMISILNVGGNISFGDIRLLQKSDTQAEVIIVLNGQNYLLGLIDLKSGEKLVAEGGLEYLFFRTLPGHSLDVKHVKSIKYQVSGKKFQWPIAASYNLDSLFSQTEVKHFLRNPVVSAVFADITKYEITNQRGDVACLEKRSWQSCSSKFNFRQL